MDGSLIYGYMFSSLTSQLTKLILYSSTSAEDFVDRVRWHTTALLPHFYLYFLVNSLAPTIAFGWS